MINLQNIHAVAPEVLQQLADNINVAKYLRDVFPNPYTLDDARFFLQLSASGQLGHVFGIYVDNSFIGVGSIVPQNDVYRNNAEIGYWLGQPYWGKGYATQAVRLLVNYAFGQGFHRIYAGVFADNKPSMRVLEKAGFTQEAVLKKSITKNNKLMDEHLYSMLKP